MATGSDTNYDCKRQHCMATGIDTNMTAHVSVAWRPEVIQKWPHTSTLYGDRKWYRYDTTRRRCMTTGSYTKYDRTHQRCRATYGPTTCFVYFKNEIFVLFTFIRKLYIWLPIVNSRYLETCIINSKIIKCLAMKCVWTPLIRLSTHVIKLQNCCLVSGEHFRNMFPPT